MIEKLLDDYELKARVAPGLILALPVLVDAVYAAPVLSTWPIFAAGGVCSLALVYGLAHLVRAKGRALEPELWRRWDGPPSTRFMRLRDQFFGPELKTSIRCGLREKFSLTLPTLSEETADPVLADKAIVNAFRQVRQYLRQRDPNGLWYKNNAEYGFCRNLVGCRALWVIVGTAATIFAAIDGVRAKSGIVNPASAIGCLSLICAVYFGWFILPAATKRTAESYAELAWMAFLQTDQPK
jgi:hypothetical protein